MSSLLTYSRNYSPNTCYRIVPSLVPAGLEMSSFLYTLDYGRFPVGINSMNYPQLDASLNQALSTGQAVLRDMGAFSITDSYLGLPYGSPKRVMRRVQVIVPSGATSVTNGIGGSYFTLDLDADYLCLYIDTGINGFYMNNMPSPFVRM
jgi:hypothetical protein